MSNFGFAFTPQLGYSGFTGFCLQNHRELMLHKSNTRTRTFKILVRSWQLVAM